MLRGNVNMQTVTIDTRAPGAPARIIRQIHERDALSAWRAIAGIDLRSWLVGSRLTIAAEDGPNIALMRPTITPSTLSMKPMLMAGSCGRRSRRWRGTA